MKLYELSQDFNDFLTLAEQEEFDEQTISDTLESLTAEITEKGRNVAAFAQNIEAEIEAMKDAEKRIADRRKALERKSEWMRDYLRNNMEACGISKIECPEFKVTLGKPSEVVTVFDESLINDKYIVIKKQPDKAAIKKAIKAGEVVEGAKLEEGKPRLIIK